jgi:hypothetical protein
MTEEELELDDLLAVASKEELDELRAAVASKRQRLEEELRNYKAPPYYIQREINAEKEYMRREIEQLAACEREIAEKILAQAFAHRRL